jgi:hypothetical protein
MPRVEKRTKEEKKKETRRTGMILMHGITAPLIISVCRMQEKERLRN